MIAWGKLNGNIKKILLFLVNNFEYRYFIGYFRIISVFGNDISVQKMLIYFMLFLDYLRFTDYFFVFPIGGADMPVVIFC